MHFLKTWVLSIGILFIFKGVGYPDTLPAEAKALRFGSAEPGYSFAYPVFSNWHIEVSTKASAIIYHPDSTLIVGIGVSPTIMITPLWYGVFGPDEEIQREAKISSQGVKYKVSKGSQSFSIIWFLSQAQISLGIPALESHGFSGKVIAQTIISTFSDKWNP